MPSGSSAGCMPMPTAAKKPVTRQLFGAPFTRLQPAPQVTGVLSLLVLAASVTRRPARKVAVQTSGNGPSASTHEIRRGKLTTVPKGLPPLPNLILGSTSTGTGSKMAVSDCPERRMIEQLGLSGQANELQLKNVESGAGLAVNLTRVPAG